MRCKFMWFASRVCLYLINFNAETRQQNEGIRETSRWIFEFELDYKF